VLKVKASMFDLQSIFLSETCCGKLPEAAENCHIFHLVSVFRRSVTHFRVAITTHQAMVWSPLCACMNFQHSSLHCLNSNFGLQNLEKKSRVFPDFSGVVYIIGRHHLRTGIQQEKKKKNT
jgi:hypothetical protein